MISLSKFNTTTAVKCYMAAKNMPLYISCSFGIIDCKSFSVKKYILLTQTFWYKSCCSFHNHIRWKVEKTSLLFSSLYFEVIAFGDHSFPKLLYGLWYDQEHAINYKNKFILHLIILQISARLVDIIGLIKHFRSRKKDMKVQPMLPNFTKWQKGTSWTGIKQLAE